MKRLYTIMIAAVLLGGCHKEVRQAFSANAVTKDSTGVATKDTVAVARLDVGGYRVTEQTEDQEAVPGSEVRVEVPVAKDTAVAAATGRASVQVTVKDGRATVVCKADSLLRVVRRMRYDSAWNAARLDSMAAATAMAGSVRRDSVATVVATKEQKSGGVSWMWIAGMVGIAFVAGWKGPSIIKLIRLI